MTRFVFIRHAETEWNRQQRFQGQIDVPLNAMGQEQARRLAARLGAEPAPDVFISSDLMRTRETAAPLAQAWRIEPRLDAGFREQNFGIVDGLDVPTIRGRHPELWASWLEQRGEFQLPGGESLRQFHDRVMAAVTRWAQEHAGAHIAVMTHGGVLDMLWRSAHGLSIDGLRRCEIPNTGINLLRWDGGRLVIDRWADASHLQGLGPPAGTAAGER